MIIFDLDGTLADCEHRRHYVDPSKRDDFYYHELSNLKQMSGWYYKENDKKFKPDWKSFHEACDQDKPIEPVITIFHSLCHIYQVEIWSGRCESVRKKTENWLNKHLFNWKHPVPLKMRPIGDNTPDDQLKERWLNERCADLITAQIEGHYPVKHDIDFVFDDRPKVVRMWRRRGIFVFNCAQHDKKF